MPKLDTANPAVREYFCEVGRYWVKNFHIDGWRLDVASEVDDGFWRAFRKAVKEIDPDVLLIGEVWESAGHWLQGDMFDSTMNYDFRKHCNLFLRSNPLMHRICGTYHGYAHALSDADDSGADESAGQP